jgi:NAD(P)-dependent dehydrogenase (short-subunit alcohol dehydrogenase family)
MQKTILITGCSSGIGLVAAKTLSARGYRVFASVRKAQDVAKLQDLGLESLIVDLDDSASIKAAVTEILAKTGGTLDGLFNNAGYSISGAVEDMTRDMLRQQFESNVFGAIELTNLILPVMRKQGQGRIIFNTSMLGVVTIPYMGNYNASKFALEAFASTLRQELYATGIFVSIIAPGPIATEFRTNVRKNYQATLAGKNSAYADHYTKLAIDSATGPKKHKVTESPDAVVAKLIAALESPKPKSRYYIGMPANVAAMLRRLLPDAGLDWVVRKMLGSDA